ncbi:unnamed protein product [Owenia fusiformis]|uniref:Uncharacterized protein n=1 Tax=Owenia fusiformis TaxID=6347 RepID=A0A8J1UAN4_OWEFU|nr:unnamed protein product [Owenia fusiformis]
MEALKVALGVCLFALFCLVEQGESISCYECNSGPDRKFDGNACEDPFGIPNSFLVNCTETYGEGYSLCRKMDQDIKGDTRTIRQCAKGGPEKCVLRTGTHKIKIQYCQCSGDGCNSASSLSISVATLGLMSAIMYLFSQ